MLYSKNISPPYLGVLVVLVFGLGFFCGRGWDAGDPSQEPTTTLSLEKTDTQENADFERSAEAQHPEQHAATANNTPVAASENGPEPQTTLARPQVRENTPEFSQQAQSTSIAEEAAGQSSSNQAEAKVKNSDSALEGSAAAGNFLSPSVLRDGPAENGDQDTAMSFSPSQSSVALHKLGSGNGPTLLVVGGIQGDEPGGFSAATVLATHYRIKTGSVWVVPGLNFNSILQRNRGLFGDMNRKFAAIDPADPDFSLVREIQSIILDDKVSLVLNLHDGSGFYRPLYEDKLRNPNRWGQSLIIDQDGMEAPRFARLFETAKTVERDVNSRLLDPDHRYHIHNTRTAEGNAQMEKTLSWFAVRNGKPAFGIEVSKEFGTDMRAYYHLQNIEAYMRFMGIEYERDFELDPKGVLAALNSNLKVAAYANRLVLDLENVRPSLNMVPFKKEGAPDQRSSKPLLALVPDEKAGNWRVAYGNRTLTRLNPQFMDFDESLDEVRMDVDGIQKTIKLGEIIDVRESFLVKGQDGYRVNAIGAQKEIDGNEADITLEHKDFLPRFSVDKAGMTYRVEIYNGEAFSGMVLVRFGRGNTTANAPLTAVPGPESDMGR